MIKIEEKKEYRVVVDGEDYLALYEMCRSSKLAIKNNYHGFTFEENKLKEQIENIIEFIMSANTIMKMEKKE